MKKFFTLLTVCFISLVSWSQTMQTFHDFSGETIVGDTISFSQFYGKKVMVVNTASQCGYTYQYGELQSLYDQYNQYNFEIIGFPSNDFNQEPKEDTDILAVCQSYNVTFQMMSKVVCTGNSAIPVYKWLQQAALNGVSNATVGWNFNKFLIDEAGNWVRHEPSSTSPVAASITNWIMSPSVISNIPLIQIDDLIELVSVNPSANNIEFLLKNAVPQHFSIKMYSNQGQFVGNIFEGTSSAQKITYAVSSLPSGVYFISVHSNEAHKTFRYSIVR